MTEAQLAHLVKVTPETLRAWRRRGEMPPVADGPEVEEFVKTLKIRARPPICYRCSDISAWLWGTGGPGGRPAELPASAFDAKNDQTMQLRRAGQAAKNAGDSKAEARIRRQLTSRAKFAARLGFSSPTAYEDWIARGSPEDELPATVQAARETALAEAPAPVPATPALERLTKYLHRASADKAQALELYVWNFQIGATLSFLLQQFEVCLRNSIAEALFDRWGPNWHNQTTFTHNNKDITKLYDKTMEKAEENCRVKQIRSSDFIAASSLAFWREICKPHWIGEIWAKRLPLSFPRMVVKKDKRENLVDLHGKVDLIYKLRNRIAHHEPILGNKYERLGAKLEDRHGDIIQILEWIDGDFCRWTVAHDRFNEVMHACPLPRS